MRRLLVLAALAACGGDAATGTTALYQLSGSDFYALPFPNDLRRHDDGTLDLSAFPTNSLLAGQYRDAAETLDGFGLNSAIFSRFTGELDPASLPDPVASIDPESSVYLVDVDTNSPD